MDTLFESRATIVPTSALTYNLVWSAPFQAGSQGPAGMDGADGAAGMDGAAGSDGRTVLNGIINPIATDGEEGDFFINTVASTIYGPKTADESSALLAWGTPTSIVGPNGADGRTILNGIVPPTLTDGETGDFFIDTAANNLYGPRTNDPTSVLTAWGTATSLVGPAGAAGGDGAAGADGRTIITEARVPIFSDGSADGGDYFINNLDPASPIIYGPRAARAGDATDNPWPTGVNLVGSAGAAGADGRTILNGIIPPVDATDGVDGDFFIDTVTNSIYGPKAAGVWPTPPTSLVGAAGADGATGATGPIWYTTSMDVTLPMIALAPFPGIRVNDFILDEIGDLYQVTAIDVPNDEITIELRSNIQGDRGFQGSFDVNLFARSASVGSAVLPAQPSGGVFSSAGVLDTATITPANTWFLDIADITATGDLYQSRTVFNPATPAAPIVWSAPFETGGMGPAGQEGPAGSIWFTSTDDLAPGTVLLTDFPTARVGDYILDSEGDVFRITDVTDPDITIVLASNIQGADGDDGSVWFTSTDDLDPTATILLTDFPTARVGDYILDSVGDVFEITVVADPDITIVFRVSIHGADGADGDRGTDFFTTDTQFAAGLTEDISDPEFDGLVAGDIILVSSGALSGALFTVVSIVGTPGEAAATAEIVASGSLQVTPPAITDTDVTVTNSGNLGTATITSGVLSINFPLAGAAPPPSESFSLSRSAYDTNVFDSVPQTITITPAITVITGAFSIRYSLASDFSTTIGVRNNLLPIDLPVAAGDDLPIVYARITYNGTETLEAQTTGALRDKRTPRNQRVTGTTV